MAVEEQGMEKEAAKEHGNLNLNIDDNNPANTEDEEIEGVHDPPTECEGNEGGNLQNTASKEDMQMAGGDRRTPEAKEVEGSRENQVLIPEQNVGTEDDRSLQEGDPVFAKTGDKHKFWPAEIFDRVNSDEYAVKFFNYPRNHSIYFAVVLKKDILPYNGITLSRYGNKGSANFRRAIKEADEIYKAKKSVGDVIEPFKGLTNEEQKIQEAAPKTHVPSVEVNVLHSI